jgi:hypothetical protein
MKLFQFLLAALLLVFAGSAFGGTVWIVTPDIGDTVNGRNFTVVAKTKSWASCDSLQLTFSVVTVGDGNEKVLQFDGVTLVADPGLSLVNKVAENLLCTPFDHQFTMVFKVEGNGPNSKLNILPPGVNPAISKHPATGVQFFHI